MLSKVSWWKTAVLLAVAPALWAGTVGSVVAIGGHASDIALDTPRGLLYVANFTANRIEVVTLNNNKVSTSINVAPQPSSLALSPDDRYLLVTHFGNNVAPSSSGNALTVIDLNANKQQTFALGSPPLGVAFGSDGRALVVTTTDFVLFDPSQGTSVELDTISGVAAKTLPQPTGTFPPSIVAASVNASADGSVIYGLGDTILFRYDVTSQTLTASLYTASPALGPRVVSVSQDGSYFTAGWALKNTRFANLSQFANPAGTLNVGTTLIDSVRNLIYAQVMTAAATTTTTPTGTGTGTGTTGTGTTTTTTTTAAATPPILQVVAADNLAVYSQLQLPENFAGKSILSADGNTMYGVSDSGVLMIPVGNLGSAHQVAAAQSDLVFRGDFCNRGVATQTLTIVDPSGGNTAFTISSNTPGLTVSPTSGVTPATVNVSVNPATFANQTGTVSAALNISSAQAVNVPTPVRVLINSHQPSQRGTFVDIPGTLVDLLADPYRNRFYILRQDQNQVLVYDSTNNTQIATFRTGNTPKGMAITFGGQYLLVGADNSHFLNVYDLDALQASAPVLMSGGDYVQSVAASSNAILAVTRSAAGLTPSVHSIDLVTRSSTKLPSLGVYTNTVPLNSVLTASPNGAAIFLAGSDGTVMLYDANANTFTVSRKDFSALSGSYAASNYQQYVVGNQLLNASLVAASQLAVGSSSSSGFAFVDQFGFFTMAPSASTAGLQSSGAGVIERLDLSTGQAQVSDATSIVEAPLLSTPGSAFTRTIAPLYDQSNIINLTVSGFTVLPWNYDASVSIPQINAIGNAADLSNNIAPGGLVSLFGSQLSPVNLASAQIPLPTALAGSCLTVNGLPVPMLFVSPRQINAQMPFEMVGNVTLVLRTPGGISNNLNIVVLPGAPGIFSGSVANSGSVPAIVRYSNGQFVTGSNPVHRSDVLTIYVTGLGKTNPAVATGLPGPSGPLASAISMPSVTLGGAGVSVLYAGLAPGEVGVYQINVKVPSNATTGNTIPLVIAQGSVTATVSVRVVD